MKLSKAVAGAALAASVIVPITASNHTPMQAAHAEVISDVPDSITVYILADGEGKQYTVKSGSVQAVLKEAGVTVGEADQINAPRASLATNKQVIVITRVTVKAVEKNVELPYTSSKQEKKVECPSGKEGEVVVTKGEKGSKVETWSEMTMDGVAQPPVKLKEAVAKEPVNEVTGECAPPPPPPAPESAPKTDEKTSSSTAKKDNKESAPAAPKANVTGTKSDWMRAAGIPESDWSAATILIQRESSWNPNAVNPSSGSCGLVQALPCSKIPGNWKDPVTALKWGHSYVTERYSTWDRALQHSYNHGWY